MECTQRKKVLNQLSISLKYFLDLVHFTDDCRQILIFGTASRRKSFGNDGHCDEFINKTRISKLKCSDKSR